MTDENITVGLCQFLLKERFNWELGYNFVDITSMGTINPIINSGQLIINGGHTDWVDLSIPTLYLYY